MKVKTDKEAWDIQEKFSNQSHGWIQWKGTNVCMDIHCKCGAFGHIDIDFAYYVKCHHCGRVYMCNGHVQLIEITEEKIENCVVEFANDQITR